MNTQTSFPSSLPSFSMAVWRAASFAVSGKPISLSSSLTTSFHALVASSTCSENFWVILANSCEISSSLDLLSSGKSAPASRKSSRVSLSNRLSIEFNEIASSLFEKACSAFQSSGSSVILAPNALTAGSISL